MFWYQWFALASLAICTGVFAFYFFRLIRLGKPRDHAVHSGSTFSGILYSFTTGMDPRKKESAFLHLPTYSAGIILHIATFASLLLFVLLFVRPEWVAPFGVLLAIVCFTGAVSGLVLLVKRMMDKRLRVISGADDYLSGLLVVVFLIFTALVLLLPEVYAAYMLVSGLLFLYMPVGKLKHAVYFFAARYHLGWFYGSRNVWP